MYTFNKSERLCSKKLIARLFVKGNRGFSRFPFRFTWVPVTLQEPVPAQVLFVVSKRNFPRALNRNRIKRLMRECYRRHKPEMYQVLGSNKQIVLSVMYTAPSELSFAELSATFATCIKQLSHDLEKNHPGTIYPAHQDL